MINKGHEHIVYTNWKDAPNDISSLKDILNIYQVILHPFISTEEQTKYKLTSYNLLCFCYNYYSIGACPFKEFCEEYDHDLTLKQRIKNHTDKDLFNIDLN